MSKKHLLNSINVQFVQHFYDKTLVQYALNDVPIHKYIGPYILNFPGW